jgi:hypothetical protein
MPPTVRVRIDALSRREDQAAVLFEVVEDGEILPVLRPHQPRLLGHALFSGLSMQILLGRLQ